MCKKLRILILEDAVEDFELMERELRKEKLAFSSKRVELILLVKLKLYPLGFQYPCNLMPVFPTSGFVCCPCMVTYGVLLRSARGLSCFACFVISHQHP